VVVADEMPNMPHIDLEQAGHYAVAKILLAVLAVTGGCRRRGFLLQPLLADQAADLPS
jgi:hypothetical protein